MWRDNKKYEKHLQPTDKASSEVLKQADSKWAVKPLWLLFFEASNLCPSGAQYKPKKMYYELIKFQQFHKPVENLKKTGLVSLNMIWSVMT